jgi:acetoacetate decarboxylase
MTYPLAPWRLKGYGFLALYWVDIDRVRPSIPKELQIFSFLPGKTLGGIYVASYEDGSTLQYHELISVSALIIHQGEIGAWISHIYVDNPDSRVGGRTIWGLPKEMAEFKFQFEGIMPSVLVKQDNTVLCSLESSWHLPGLEFPMEAPAFSLLNSQLVQFKAKGNLRSHWAGIRVEIPPESPIADLNLGQPWITVLLSSLDVDVQAPAIV